MFMNGAAIWSQWGAAATTAGRSVSWTAPYIALQIPSQKKMRTPLRFRIAAIETVASPVKRNIDPLTMSAI